MKIQKKLTSWQLIELIAKAVKADKRFPKDGTVATYGPFGLRAYSSLYVKDADGEIVATITVETAEAGYLYETGEVTNAYPKGSIGAMNNMNHVCAALPDDMDAVVDIAYHLAKGKSQFTVDLLVEGKKFSFTKMGFDNLNHSKQCLGTAVVERLQKVGYGVSEKAVQFSITVTYEDENDEYVDSDEGVGVYQNGAVRFVA